MSSFAYVAVFRLWGLGKVTKHPLRSIPSLSFIGRANRHSFLSSEGSGLAVVGRLIGRLLRTPVPRKVGGDSGADRRVDAVASEGVL